MHRRRGVEGLDWQRQDPMGLTKAMMSAWRVRRMNVAALSCIIALVLPWAEARGGMAAAAHPMSTLLAPWGGAGDGRGAELGRGHGGLRLRGGGWLEDAMCCFGCRGGNHLEVDSGGDGDSAGGDGGKQKKRHRAGRMERKLHINAPISRIFRVCSDYEHYGDWTGNGIKKCIIAERRQGFVHAVYTTGVFGLTFDFALYWSTAVQNKITFRNVKPMGAVHLLKGEYQFTDLGDGTTEVRFQIIADLHGPIPQFIKVAIAKLIVRIALDDLNTYITSQSCIDNLAKYDKTEGRGGAFQTLRQHITKLYSDVPDMVNDPDNLRKMGKSAAKLALAALLFRRFFLREQLAYREAGR